METNQEALDALSLSDIITLKNYAVTMFSETGNREYIDVRSECVKEIDKRIANVFIF